MSSSAARMDAPRGNVVAWLLVGALYALNVALYPFAALVVDSGRDLANGLAIASGAGIPPYGPMLFGTWHLGPAWYVLLALPLWLTGSVAGTATFVGLLAALKIPLAYLLGLRLGDRTLALLCAAFAALPGWQVLGALVISHTALVEALVYGTLLCCVVAVQARRPVFAVLAALLLALALHAHPTALVVAPAVAWALWGSTSRRVGVLFAGAVVFLLPFASMLVAETLAGWPQLAGTGRYLGDGGFGARLQRVPAVAWGAGWHGTEFVRVFLLRDVPIAGWGLQVFVGLAWVRAIVGAVFGLRRGSRAAIYALLAWLAATAFVCLLRDATPAWMTYALAPLQVLAWAFGWHVLAGATGSARPLAMPAAAAAVAVAIGVLLLVDRVAVSASGLQAMPGAAVGDVVRRPADEAATRGWLTAFGHDRVARELCAGDQTVMLHGDLAAAIDLGESVAVALHCPAARVPWLGGREGAVHRVGLPRAVAAQLGVDGDDLAGFTVLAPLRVLFPATGRRAWPETAYRADTLAALGTRGVVDARVDVACGAGELLAVTNRLPDVNPLAFDLRREGVSVAPVLSHLATRYFACDGGALVLSLRTIDVASIDVFVLPGR